MSDQSLPAIIERTQTAVAAAQAGLADLTEAVRRSEEALRVALEQAARAAAFAAFDPDLLQQFLAKPYLVRPLGGGRYELIVPRFLGLRAGWPLRETDGYAIYEVSRLLHMLAPLPDWLARELGIGAPSFQAVLDGLDLVVTDGDAADVAARLDKGAIARRSGNRLTLRPASRFAVVRRIIREEGFLPFAPAPIPASLRRPRQVAQVEATGQPAYTLRPYQVRAYEEFLTLGAIAVFARPQTGKTFLALEALASLTGPKLVLCPRRTLVEQWRARLALYLTEAAAAEVTLTTYQSARKYLDQPWTLVIFDEAQHVPADFAIEAATALKAPARMGLSSTPHREDGAEDLIPALCGFPTGADWPVAPVQMPTVTVWVVKDEAAKLNLARRLCAEPVRGRTLVFVQRLDVGRRLAAALEAPFISSDTRRPAEVIAAHPLIVSSSVLDEGISVPDLRRVIEVDFLFGSRMQAGQRAGRLANQAADATSAGDYHVAMIPDELHRYHKRLLIYELWGLTLSVRVDEAVRSQMIGGRTPVLATRPRRRASSPAASAPAKADGLDDLRSVPAIAAKLRIAEGQLDSYSAYYVPILLRACARAALRPEDVAEGRGVASERTVRRIRAAARALADVGLLAEVDHGRYQVNADELARLRSLAATLAMPAPIEG